MAKANSQMTTLDNEDPVEVAEQVATVSAKIVGTNADGELSGKRRTITIHPTEGDAGSDAVAVGVNGYMYQIPRGMPVSIPIEVLDILKNAKTTHYTALSGGTVGERTVQRHAFSVE